MCSKCKHEASYMNFNIYLMNSIFRRNLSQTSLIDGATKQMIKSDHAQFAQLYLNI